MLKSFHVGLTPRRSPRSRGGSDNDKRHRTRPHPPRLPPPHVRRDRRRVGRRRTPPRPRRRQGRADPAPQADRRCLHPPLDAPRNPAIPAFIDVGQRLDDIGEKEELKAFHTAGFLGTEYGPFLLPYPDQAIESVRPPKGMTPGRFAERYKKFQELVKRSPLGEQASDYQRESMLRALANADRLLNSPERKA